MNHRPFCLLGAGLVLTLGVVVGNPFLVCPRGAGDAGPAVPAAAPVHVDATPMSPSLATPVVLPAAPVELLDPDRVGPCPQLGLPAVLRRGLDGDGLPTWWHVDGSITKRVEQLRDGVLVPTVKRSVADPAVSGESDEDTPRQ